MSDPFEQLVGSTLKLVIVPFATRKGSLQQSRPGGIWRLYWSVLAPGRTVAHSVGDAKAVWSRLPCPINDKAP